ncbi:50S ribosomal protein L22 [Streptobacillus felis]|uniref:Large ribosomal subunit protein uL22 n=1 Tax=Streptobacillus felis TaxID=1384509 RepID=A0A7Z0PFC9_9FUSO|nr:50S ribosomal protein L22 [Streptobacillus felis]NYV28019.1 50S ribosomal protein L22 [Streptobacillus felis]
MPAVAKLRYQRLSPQKARLVADVIRGKDALLALNILRFTNKKAAPLIEKTLRSAIANAEHNLGLNPENLIVSKVLIDKGPVLKRMNPRAMGRADIIRKPLAHITVEVDVK